MSAPLLGLTVFPDAEFMAGLQSVLPLLDFVELSPELLYLDGIQPAARRAEFLDWVRRNEIAVVGHGLSGNLGGVEPLPAGWLERLRADQRDFEFAWYSEHLGPAGHGGVEVTLPLPLPPSDEAVGQVAARLRTLAEVVPQVGFEHIAVPLTFMPALDEPAFLNRIAREAACGIVLDLHNAYVQCVNAGVELDDWLARLECERVLEIHLAGGQMSDPAWLPSGRSLRLDSHDAPIPDPVWTALEAVLPRCTGLRGVVLERLPQALPPAAWPPYAAEVARARELLCSAS